MSNCPAITMQDISAERYAQLLVTAQAQGLGLAGESGSTQFQGMGFSWSYDRAAEVLTIQCTEKPMFVPCSMIEARIRGLVG